MSDETGRMMMRRRTGKGKGEGGIEVGKKQFCFTHPISCLTRRRGDTRIGEQSTDRGIRREVGRHLGRHRGGGEQRNELEDQ